MAISAVVWEVRATGAATNGGGFDSAFNGTDYSQQDSPQLTVTDGTSNSGTAVLTSVTGGFTTPMAGNVLTFDQGGTFRGFWQIISVQSTNQVTLDRNSPVTAANSTIKVGGALKITTTGFPPNLNTTSAVVPGQKVWIKAGAYTPSTNDLQFGASGTNGTAQNPIVVEGYNTTRGDITLDPTLARPTITPTGGAQVPLSLAGTNWIVRALQPQGTGTIAAAVQFETGSVGCVVENCVVVAGASSAGVNVTGTRNWVRKNWIRAGGTASDGVVVAGSSGHTIEENTIQCTFGNTFTGIAIGVEAANIRRNVISGFTFGILNGSATVGHMDIEGNILYHNVNGLYFNNAAQGPMTARVRANIFSSNTVYDVRHNTASYVANARNAEAMSIQFDCNFFYTTGTRYSQLNVSASDVTLSADPFLDPANGDFTLNSNSGAGETVRGTPCTSTWADGINSTILYAGISAPAAQTGVASMRSLWREYTGELSAEISDDVVDIYLQAGLEALNRRVHYHYTSSESAVTLLAETQEYTLPTDCIEVLWVYLNGSKLQKRDVEDWDKREEQWREEPSGTPVEYAHEGNRIIFRPKPNAAAVAADSTPSIRYISTPPSITTYGPEQLVTEGYRVVVFRGAQEWSLAHPDAALAVQRAKGLGDLFESESQGIAEQYRARALAR